MFTAKVYNVMVGSLSGITEEVTVVREVIRNWNQENVERDGKLFMNMDWNEKIDDVQKIDVVIGLVDNWIEKTELVEACIKSGKRVILFFNAFADPGNTIESEHQAVAAFRKRMQSHCRCLEFRGSAQLKQRVVEAIGEI